MTPASPRLPAPERRAALLECACRVFSEGSYRGTTTSEIASEAGVTEPVLYRHFESKRELYLACLDHAWDELRARWDEAVAAEESPREWIGAMGRAYFDLPPTLQIGNLWLQTLAEASEDPVLRARISEHFRDVHAYVREIMCRSREAGGVRAEHDVTAEAWLFIAQGLLKTIDERVGGILGDDFARIVASRRRWLLGE
ncbi:MAG: TetR/AcrR family transcriptional regulator [Actinobacteria bacterium]|nr:TetR/AcrR family transcriptional regulator [Actinomycetota bacterium]